jgi:predicted TPR repeat methyltransferase
MYFGDLDALVAGLAHTLRRGGRFVFDVEKGEGMTSGFHVSGRYTHSLALLEKALQPHGFVLTQVHEMVMRSELGKPVAGLHVVARLPA